MALAIKLFPFTACEPDRISYCRISDGRQALQLSKRASNRTLHTGDRLVAHLSGKRPYHGDGHIEAGIRKRLVGANTRLVVSHGASCFYIKMALVIGLVFVEALTYLERASDQCSSIAVMMMARNNEKILMNHYDYLREIHSGNDVAYNAEKDRRREQYITPLIAIQ